MQKSVLEFARGHPVPSLKKLGLLRVTTMLCNNSRLLQSILKVHMYPFLDKCYVKVTEADWAAVQAMANRWIAQLVVGVALEEEIREMLWTLSYRILEWKERYANTLGKQFLTHFYWTDQGRIDSIKTIRYMIRNRRLPLRKRFTLACIVCLSEEIREMWSKMSNADKRFCYETNRQVFRPLLIFWAHSMGGPFKFEGCMDCAIECALEYRLVEAVKYLFSYLTEYEREDNALKGMRKLLRRFNRKRLLLEHEIEIFYFLFFEMTDVNQEIFLDIHSVLFLSLLLHSPEKQLFLDLLSERIQSLSGHDIKVLLRIILNNYHLGIADYDYGVLFFDVWRMLPSPQRHFLGESTLGLVFLISLIFNHFPFLIEERAFQKMPKFVASAPKSSNSATRFGFHRGRWNFLYALIREEVVTVASIKKNERRFNFFTYLLTKKGDEKNVSNRILRFVTKARNKFPVS